MRRIGLLGCYVMALLACASAQGETFRAADQPLNLKGADTKTLEWLKSFAPIPSPSTIPSSWPTSSRACASITSRSLADEDALRREQLGPRRAVPAPLKPQARSPAVIVLDILDGRAILPRVMARALAMRGVAALYFPMPYYNARRPAGTTRQELLLRAEQDVNNLLSPIRQTVMDVRRRKRCWPPARTLTRSASVSPASASAESWPRSRPASTASFYRVAPIIAGGDIATLVFHARELRRVRQLLEDRGLGRDDLAKLLAPVEPLNFASRIDPVTCLMINAANDEVIPKATTLALRKTIGDPTILWMPTGHYSCVLFLPNAQQKVADFMLGQRVTTLSFDGPTSKPAK